MRERRGEAELDARDAVRDLARHELEPAPRRLVIEQHARHREEVVALAIVHRDVVREHLRRPRRDCADRRGSARFAALRGPCRTVHGLDEHLVEDRLDLGDEQGPGGGIARGRDPGEQEPPPVGPREREQPAEELRLGAGRGQGRAQVVYPRPALADGSGAPHPIDGGDGGKRDDVISLLTRALARERTRRKYTGTQPDGQGRRLGPQTPALIDESVLHQRPQGREAVLPGDLLALGVVAPLVGDRHLVDARPALEELGRDLGLDAEALAVQGERSSGGRPAPP